MNQFQIYNSMTHKKEIFKPIEDGKIKLYVCGITVYDVCHLGHARMAIVYDYIVKFLRYQGWEVKFCRNITDIDDKIINKANEHGENYLLLAERFIKEMTLDFSTLGCSNPDMEPRATHFISQMQDITQRLIDKNHAYVAENNDVYFSVESFQRYGMLSNRKIEDMKSMGESIDGVKKKNPFDFALWKSSKPNEPFWKLPWGNLRPGWHLECSAMAHANLGVTIDIHGGGLDLKFPHHENEIAQSECAFGTTFANNWMHVGFINVDGKKMSKSLGNYITIKDALKKYHPEVIRLFVLSSHYRQPINYIESSLKQFKIILENVYSFYQKYNIEYNYISNDYEFNEMVANSSSIKKFNKCMSDDFNTVDALNVMYEIISDMQSTDDNYIRTFKVAELDYIGNIFGLFKDSVDNFLLYGIDDRPSKNDIVKAIEDRSIARFNRDYALADYLREYLTNNHVVVEDKCNGEYLWHYRVKS